MQSDLTNLHRDYESLSHLLHRAGTCLPSQYTTAFSPPDLSSLLSFSSRQEERAEMKKRERDENPGEGEEDHEKKKEEEKQSDEEKEDQHGEKRTRDRDG